MNVTEAVSTRRAVKRFDPEHCMPEDTFRQLMEHAIQAPTAFNIQNWRFVRVTDLAQRQAIRAVAWDQAQVTEASELLVLCFDNKAWDREPGRYWCNAPQEVQDFLVPAIADYYRGKPQIERDEGMRSCGLVAQNLMLVAQQLGYESCPMDGFDYAKVGEIIGGSQREDDLDRLLARIHEEAPPVKASIFGEEEDDQEEEARQVVDDRRAEPLLLDQPVQNLDHRPHVLGPEAVFAVPVLVDRRGGLRSSPRFSLRLFS